MRSAYAILISLVFPAIVLSCSNAQHNPVTTESVNTQGPGLSAVIRDDSGRYLVGMYDFEYHPETSTATVLPNRDIAKHWNVLKFLDQSPCEKCVSVVGAIPNGDGSIAFNVRIKSPFVNKTFTGFDLRGIAMFNGSYYFPIAGLTSSVHSLGDGELVDADGYTTLYNSTTEAHGPFEGYFKGDLATPTTPNSNLNGFISYQSEIPAGNPRTIFNAGDTVDRIFNIFLPTGAFVFGYAVDVSWAPPTVTPVTNPETDFPPEANSPEPFIFVNQEGAGLSSIGGNVTLVAHLYDYGGKSKHNDPTFECPGLFTGIKTGIYEYGDQWSVYTLSLSGSQLLPTPGTYRCLITAESKANLTSPPHLNLTTYQIVTIEVVEDFGFVHVVGGTGFDAGNGVDVSADGYVYQTGFFDAAGNPVDFDPTGGVDLHTSNGLTDIYLSKLDVYGNYYWTVTFGGTGIDTPLDVSVTLDGSLITVCGIFSGTMDLTGLGGPALTSNGGTDAFMVQFLNYQPLNWAVSWGGTGNDSAKDLCAIGEEIVVGGAFENTVDFNPDPAFEWTFTSSGKLDGYIATYSLNGDYTNSRKIGGQDNDEVNAVSKWTGFYYLAGYFEGTADLEPNELSQDDYTSTGFQDGFLIRMDSWDPLTGTSTEQIFTGSLSAVATGLYVDLDGNVYTVGYFAGIADFAYFATPEYEYSNGGFDAFLTADDYLLNHQYSTAWGGLGNDAANSVSVRLSNNVIYVCGSYQLDCDFDPGSGTSMATSNGGSDCFVTAFNKAGPYLWSRQFGSASGDDNALKIEAYYNDSVFTTGGFWDQVQFAPPGDLDNRASNGQNDSFLMKYLDDGTW